MPGLLLFAAAALVLGAALWLFHRADQARRDAQRESARPILAAGEALVEERARMEERVAELERVHGEYIEKLLAQNRELITQVMWLANKPWEIAPAAMPAEPRTPPPPQTALLGVDTYVGDDDLPPLG